MSEATNVDFFAKASFFHPDGVQAFLGKESAVRDLFAFTEHDERDVYDTINVERTPELRQDGKVVVVTGARGIGRAIAVMSAKAGARAVAIGARTISELEETKAEISKVNPATQVHIAKLDVTSNDSVKTFFEQVKAEYGTIDVLVSNAGSNDNQEMLADSDPERWWKDMEINIKGTYLGTKYFLQAIGQNQGTLISISSSNALAAIPTQSCYCAGKAAIIRMLETVHLEAQNVRVFSLHPGLVKTAMSTQHGRDKMIGWGHDSVQLPAGVCLYLASPRADFLRGRWISANWRVDELEARKTEIMSENLLKTGFMAKLGR